MKKVIRANEDVLKTVSNVHIVQSEASIGSGFVTDRTYTGSLSKLLNTLAQKASRYVANPGRQIHSNLSKLYNSL